MNEFHHSRDDKKPQSDQQSISSSPQMDLTSAKNEPCQTSVPTSDQSDSREDPRKLEPSPARPDTGNLESTMHFIYHQRDRDVPQLYISSYSRPVQTEPLKIDVQRKRPVKSLPIPETAAVRNAHSIEKDPASRNTDGNLSCRKIDLNFDGDQNVENCFHAAFYTKKSENTSNKLDERRFSGTTRPLSASRDILRLPSRELCQALSPKQFDIPRPGSQHALSFNSLNLDVPTSQKKARPKTAVCTLKSRPYLSSGMKTAQLDEQIRPWDDGDEGIDTLLITRTFCVGKPLYIQEPKRILNEQLTSQKNSDPIASPVRRPGNEEGGRDVEAGSFRLRQEDLKKKPAISESASAVPPRVLSSRPGSALRPWSTKAKENCDLTLWDSDIEQAATMIDSGELSCSSAQKPASARSKKSSPRKGGDVKATRKSVAEPQEIAGAPEVKGRAPNGSVMQAPVNSSESAVQKLRGAFVCSVCRRSCPQQEDTKSPVALNFQESTRSGGTDSTLRDDCNSLAALSESAVHKQAELESMPLETSWLQLGQDFMSVNDRNLFHRSFEVLEQVADQIFILVNRLSEFASNEIKKKNSLLSSALSAARKYDESLLIHESEILVSSGKVSELKHRVEELESAHASLDLESLTSQVMKSWEHNKKLIGLSERATLNALATAVSIQAEDVIKSKKAAMAILNDAEEILNQKFINEKTLKSLDEKAAQLRSLEESLTYQRKDLDFRQSSLSKELELTIGTQVVEKSTILKELRLLVVENERLKLKLLQTEQDKSHKTGSDQVSSYQHSSKVLDCFHDDAV